MALQGGGVLQKGEEGTDGSHRGWEGGFAGWVGSCRQDMAKGRGVLFQ